MANKQASYGQHMFPSEANLKKNKWFWELYTNRKKHAHRYFFSQPHIINTGIVPSTPATGNIGETSALISRAICFKLKGSVLIICERGGSRRLHGEKKLPEFGSSRWLY